VLSELLFLIGKTLKAFLILKDLPIIATRKVVGATSGIEIIG
jgi:hypothetical protein